MRDRGFSLGNGSVGQGLVLDRSLVVMSIVTNVSKIGNFFQSFFSHSLSNFSRRRLYEIAAQQRLNLTNRRRRKDIIYMYVICIWIQ